MPGTPSSRREIRSYPPSLGCCGVDSCCEVIALRSAQVILGERHLSLAHFQLFCSAAEYYPERQRLLGNVITIKVFGLRKAKIGILALQCDFIPKQKQDMRPGRAYRTMLLCRRAMQVSETVLRRRQLDRSQRREGHVRARFDCATGGKLYPRAVDEGVGGGRLEGREGAEGLFSLLPVKRATEVRRRTSARRSIDDEASGGGRSCSPSGGRRRGGLHSGREW